MLCSGTCYLSISLSLTLSLSHSLTLSLSHSLTPSLPHSLTPSLPHSLTPSLPLSLSPSLPLRPVPPGPPPPPPSLPPSPPSPRQADPDRHSMHKDIRAWLWGMRVVHCSVIYTLHTHVVQGLPVHHLQEITQPPTALPDLCGWAHLIHAQLSLGRCERNDLGSHLEPAWCGYLPPPPNHVHLLDFSNED